MSEKELKREEKISLSMQGNKNALKGEKKRVMISIKVDPDDRERWKKKAEEKGLSLTNYIESTLNADD